MLDNAGERCRSWRGRSRCRAQSLRRSTSVLAAAVARTAARLSVPSPARRQDLPARLADAPTSMGKAKGEGLKTIVAVLPPGGAAASNPAYLNCVEHGLGLRKWLESLGHKFIVTADKDGPNCEFEQWLPKADIVITTPFHPAYMTRERIMKAKELELITTAGVGSDHIDLHAAAEKGITVAEVTGSNVESVAEDEIARMLILIRNFLPGYLQIINDEWDVAAVTSRAWDIKEKTVGTVGGGRIARHVLKRLKEWDVKLMYYERHRKPACDEFGAEFTSDLDAFLAACDIVTINVPLTDRTRHMFNKETISKMKRGAILVNNARGAICETDAVVEALKSGQLGGYGGDVWPIQPAPKDHPWRHMPHHAMTPHVSGTTLDAQRRYAQGTRIILERWFQHQPLPEDFYIVREGKLAEQYT